MFIGIRSNGLNNVVNETLSSQTKAYRDQSSDPDTLLAYYSNSDTTEGRDEILHLHLVDTNGDGWGDGSVEGGAGASPYLQIYEGSRLLDTSALPGGKAWVPDSGGFHKEFQNSLAIKTDNAASIRLRWKVIEDDHGQLDECFGDLMSGNTSIYNWNGTESEAFSENDFLYIGSASAPTDTGIIRVSRSGDSAGIIGLFNPNETGINSVARCDNKVFGNGNLYFLNGATTTEWTGETGFNIYGRRVKHFTFDGTDDYMGAPGAGYSTDPGFYLNFNNSFTISHWVMFRDQLSFGDEGSSSTYYPFASAASTAGGKDMSINISLGIQKLDDEYYFAFKSPDKTNAVIGNKKINLDEWYMVTYVFSIDKASFGGGHVQMYVNKQADGFRFQGSDFNIGPDHSVNQSLMTFIYLNNSDPNDLTPIRYSMGKGIGSTPVNSAIKLGHFVAYDLALKQSEIRNNYEALREYYVMDPISVI